MSKRPFNINGNVYFHVFVCLLVIVNILLQVDGYCWLPGRNPSFVAGPTVTQINLAKVQVSWRDIIKSKECVDQFLVKFWKKGSPSNYKQSDLVGTSIDAIVLTGIIPKVEYVYQVIAREDKLVGIDYNRSPTTKFTTSRKTVKKVEIEKNLTSLNVVSVDSHKAQEKYNPATNVIESNQIDFTSQRNGIQGIILQERGPSSTVRDFKRNYDEDDFHVVFILALIALGMFTLIIIVGVLHNCIKRLKHTRSSVSESDDSTSVQIYSPSAPKDTLSYPEVVHV